MAAKVMILGAHKVGEMVWVEIEPASVGMYGEARKVCRCLLVNERGELYIRYYGAKVAVVWCGGGEYAGMGEVA